MNRVYQSRRQIIAAVAVVFAAAGPVQGHPLAPSLLELRELGNGNVELRWKTSLLRPGGTDIRPVLPDRCRAVEHPRATRQEGSATYRWVVDCGPGSLVGATVGVTGLSASKTNVLVRVVRLDGQVVRALLNGDQPTLTIPARQGRLRLAASYLNLGVEHLLSGVDHLAFLFGLVLLVTTRRRLLATITGFTVGHSVTLSLAMLGLVHIPPAPVEAAIAFTILWLAVELTRRGAIRRTLTQRYPWAMASMFGLLHGLGFAGALAQVGLPAEEVPLALLSFNIGIELGQVVFVAIILAFIMACRPVTGRLPAWTALSPAYALGSLAAFWFIERTAVLL